MAFVMAYRLYCCGFLLTFRFRCGHNIWHRQYCTFRMQVVSVYISIISDSEINFFILYGKQQNAEKREQGQSTHCFSPVPTWSSLDSAIAHASEPIICVFQNRKTRVFKCGWCFFRRIKLTALESPVLSLPVLPEVGVSIRMQLVKNNFIRFQSATYFS